MYKGKFLFGETAKIQNFQDQDVIGYLSKLLCLLGPAQVILIGDFSEFNVEQLVYEEVPQRIFDKSQFQYIDDIDVIGVEASELFFTVYNAYKAII